MAARALPRRWPDVPIWHELLTLAVGHMSDDIDLHLGKRMRRRRRLLGLTQEQLANACGVRFQQIQKYECGANRVSAARLFRIARALDVQMNYFFEGLAEGAVAARDETIEVVRNHPALGERPRRALLDVSHSLRRDTDAA
jgi:transcriptional regulator with XRE-family HTH domain